MKEQFIKNAQAQFLKETIEFYKNPNRATGKIGCVYRPINNSPGCAIGRHIPNKLLCEDFDRLGGLACWGPEELINLGPLWALGLHFLMEVQRLHDSQGFNYWTDTGLSDLGRSQVIRICQIFGLDADTVLGQNNPPAE